MITNYLKIALRITWRHKGYSIINIFGLAAGMACCILILLYVQDELSYDRCHENFQRIYRVIGDEKNEGQVRHVANTYGPLAPALLSSFSEIEHAVRFFPYSATVQSGEQKFQEERFFFTDSTVSKVFTFQFKRGDPRTALNSPYGLILTQSTAEKYFGQDDALGKVLRIENRFDFTITGVLEDLPSNLHFKFDFLAPMSHVTEIMGWKPRWHWPPMYTYLLLPEGYPAADLEKQFPDFIAKHIGAWAKDERALFLQPLSQIYLTPDLENEIEPTSNIAYVYIFSGIAFFILLIACINFINLSTARSTTRAKEVGLRKVVGAQRAQLIKQFLSESLFYAFLGLLLAVGLVELLLPAFNRLAGKALNITYLDNPTMTGGLIALTIFVGLVSGSYPALLLSNFRPITVLKGTLTTTFGARTPLRLRALLVVLQFAISIGLMGITYVVNRQLDFMQNKRLGFNKEHVVIIPVRDEEVQKNFETIKNRLLANSNVLTATALSNFPWRGGFYDFPIQAEGLPAGAHMVLPVLIVDHDFIRTFGIELAAGRDFSREFTTDVREAFILNETAVKKLGWESAVGKTFEVQHVAEGGSRKGQVIGVVKDFHFRSLHHEIEPLVVMVSPVSYYLDNFAVRIHSSHLSETLAALASIWMEILPHRPFEYFFLDEDFDQLYRKEQKLEQIFESFSVLAIFIASLGLFGLASFALERRRKEIGIRKTLGAGVHQIVFLFSKDFARLTLVANVIAWPITYYIMSQWLRHFAYRTEIGWEMFFLTGAAALLIALLTVSAQAIKAALTNPVESLRYE